MFCFKVFKALSNYADVFYLYVNKHPDNIVFIV